MCSTSVAWSLVPLLHMASKQTLPTKLVTIFLGFREQLAHLSKRRLSKDRDLKNTEERDAISLKKSNTKKTQVV